MRAWRSAVPLFFALSLASPSFAIPGQTPPAPKKDTAVHPTSWGHVTGQVYDAVTGAPIQNAAVSVQDHGAFADAGRTTGKTDEMGRYHCDAVIGRVSSNLDLGRLLDGGLITLVLGGAVNETKRIDVTRLNVRITCDGYNLFEGVVLCRKSSPSHFEVAMEPILLTRAGSDEVSTTAEGWGVVRIEEVKIDPSVVRPGGKARVTVLVKSPRILNLHDMSVTANYALTDKEDRRGLKPAPSPAEGTLAFTGDITAPKSKNGAVAEVTASILNCPYDVAPDGRRARALIQVVPEGEGDEVAADRAEAYRLEQQGDTEAAAEKLKAICGGSHAELWDYVRLAKLSEVLHDSGGTVQALKRAVEIAPAKPELARSLVMGAYVSALVAQGQGQEAVTQFDASLKAMKEKDKPGHLAVPLVAAMGSAYVQTGRLTEAEALNEELLKWPGAGLYPETIAFRSSLTLARAQAALKREPNSAQAHLAYGRALMDQGRWEEAASAVQDALNIDPNLGIARRELAYALLHLKGQTPAADQDLDGSLTAAEGQVEFTDPKGKVSRSKDFHAWHTLAILRYVKACRLRSSGDSAASAEFGRARGALMEALKCGRSGADVAGDEPVILLGYARPRVVTISGFAYPEANSDFVLMDSLEGLEAKPNDYLAEYNLGTALIDLGEPALARQPIERALALKPDFVEAKYARALVELNSGERDAALADLRAVVKRNPRHSHANLTLARLYTEDGDMASASVCLAAHAAVYGTTAQ